MTATFFLAETGSRLSAFFVVFTWREFSVGGSNFERPDLEKNEVVFQLSGDPKASSLLLSDRQDRSRSAYQSGDHALHWCLSSCYLTSCLFCSRHACISGTPVSQTLTAKARVPCAVCIVPAECNTNPHYARRLSAHKSFFWVALDALQRWRPLFGVVLVRPWRGLQRGLTAEALWLSGSFPTSLKVKNPCNTAVRPRHLGLDSLCKAGLSNSRRVARNAQRLHQSVAFLSS